LSTALVRSASGPPSRLLGSLVLALGCCALGLGIFVALPVYQLAICVAYMAITGRGAPSVQAQ
jgi:hypothetical protein